MAGDGINSKFSLHFGADVTNTKQTVHIGSSMLRGWSSEGVGFVQLFDALAADVTVGTTVPKFVIPVNNLGQELVTPIPFAIGIVVASTSARANNVGALQEINIRFHDA